MEQIIVTIKPDGSMSYKVNGVKGKSCKDLTKFIDEMGQVADTKTTPEFCQLPAQNTQKNYNSAG